MLAFAMPASMSREEVEKIAALAQLELTAREIDLFARQLGEILEYANQVQQIETAGVTPTASVARRHDAGRPDEPIPSIDRSDALANAPERASDAGMFKVPRVIG
jgi:aspartyl-tRNA(Asn)/glutamyl-tRNA(Gln) amidotransferase subunit C